VLLEKISDDKAGLAAADDDRAELLCVRHRILLIELMRRPYDGTGDAASQRHTNFVSPAEW
jgi:hypothetical protein